MKRVIIVGAGAAGVYLSILLKQCCDMEVIVLEQNAAPLKKLLATGNGRCNLSNKDMNVKYYQSDNQDLVENIISHFDMEKAMNDLGILCTYMNNLLYPRSEQALTIKNVMMDIATHLGVIFLYDQQVNRIKVNDRIEVITDHNTYYADDVILAMGSPAGQLSGLNFLRYNILEKLHLNVITPTPSLVQMYTQPVFKKLKGVRVKGTFTLMEDEILIHQEKGELLFTDYGVSGIAVMQLSAFYKPGHQYKLYLDLFDDIDEGDLYNLIATQRDKVYNHIYDGLIHSKVASYLETLSFDNLHECAHYLKHWPLKVTGIREAQYAQVMKGGLSLHEMNNDLQIIKYPHLYVIGEQCNVTGMCGGYNLHFALASAKRVADALEREYHA